MTQIIDITPPNPLPSALQPAKASVIYDAPGARRVTRHELAQIPMPEPTRTHRPVPFADLVGLVERVMSARGLELASEEHCLARDDNQYFGALVWKSDRPDYTIANVLRNSRDKTLRGSVAAGPNCVACANIAIFDGDVRVMRKNTTFAERDLHRLVDGLAEQTLGAVERGMKDVARLASKPCTLDAGFGVLGRAIGHNILGARQAKQAFGDWRNFRHEVETHANRNFESLYQTMTEALKSAPVASRIEQQTRAHAFIMSEV